MALKEHGLTVNYHTHTTRCSHATGTDRQYVEAAIKAGFKVLGFSDHSPYFYSSDPTGERYPFYMMKPNEAEEYFNSVRELREEYKNDIEIHVGVEMEYYPRDFEKTYELIKSLGCEYCILGQHFLDNDDLAGRKPSSFATEDKARLDLYTDRCIEAMQTGKFIYMAHPDVIHFVGDKDYYAAASRRLCETAKSLGVPIELNLLGIREGRYYPNGDFWKIAGEVGGDVVLGVDAHSPEAFLDGRQYAVAAEIIDKFGLNVKLDLNI